jgi:hypothetical protein
MLVLVVSVFVGMLMGVNPGLMFVLVPVMAVGTTFVAMLVVVFVLVMATHRGPTPFFINYR